MKPEVLGLVPARGGSKGVLHKNRRLVGGWPLIQYTLDAALAATALTRTVVTTDDPQVADIARRAGVEVVERPAAIAADTSPVIDAVRHALVVLAERGHVEPQAVVLLQPTAPLRSAQDIDAAVALFFEHDGNPVCSVVACEDNHPARMYGLDSQQRLSPLMPELASLRRQDLPPVFHRNGAVYVFGPREVASGAIIGPQMTPYPMGQDRSLNIDTEFDLAVMEAVLARR